MNRVAGRTAATAGTNGAVGCALWNASASMWLTVYEVSLFATTAPAASAAAAIQRISARGTATSTVTPGIANDTNGTNAPSTGALLDVTYSAQPTAVGTLVTNALWRFPLSAVISAGFEKAFTEGIRVPPGQGLCIMTVGAVILPASDVSFLFDE